MPTRMSTFGDPQPALSTGSALTETTAELDVVRVWIVFVAGEAFDAHPPAFCAARILRTGTHCACATDAVGIFSVVATSCGLAGSFGPIPDRSTTICRSLADRTSRHARRS